MEKPVRPGKVQKEKARNHERLLSILPMRKHFLKSFFDFLDDHIEKERMPSLNLTERFCRDNAIDFEKVREWAKAFEAFNDQDILWKVEEEYSEIINAGKSEND